MFPTGMIALLMTALPGPDAWPGFRGDGSSRTEARNLPLSWSPKENLAWRITTPGYGQSAPIVWKDRVFVTAVDGPEKEKCLVLAFATATGKAVWRKEFATTLKGKNSPTVSRAAPTPVADAAGVYAFFESGDLICLSHDGEVKWQRSLVQDHGELKNNHGLGSSPAQTDRAVIVLVDHGGPSYLLAVEKATGKTLWKADRKSRMSWTSPVVATQEGRSLVLVSSSGSLTAYDAATGKELWDHAGLTGNTIPSPTVAGDRVVVGAGENRRMPDLDASRRSNCCLKLTLRDGKPGCESVWQGTKAISHHASPLIHRDLVYIVNRAGFLHCLDLKTGLERYVRRLDNPCWATPIAAGEHVYFFGKDGVTTVVKAGPAFEKVASNRLWSDDDFATRKDQALKRPENQPSLRPKGAGGKKGGPPPGAKGEAEKLYRDAVGDVVYGAAAVDGAFFVRTGTELFCLREGKSARTDRPLTRLIFQHNGKRSLSWADVGIDEKGLLSLGPVAGVEGLEPLDAGKQKLVQMRESNGLVLVGVRDEEDGGFESGWVLLHTGVGYTDHGDHGHWSFKKKPAVWDSRLDKNQGNPAHVYVYGGRFFLANDRLNGYTRIDPARYEMDNAGKLKKDRPRFLVGGGNHITLAVVEDKVGYSCWIDGGGPNKGRVDVTPITSKDRSEPAYSFRLPSGVIHGAITCGGKVFFAPADGVCWVEADLAAKLTPEQVKVHHIRLGNDGDKPRRTGAFASHGRYVLCVTGSSLVLLDARAREPRPIHVPLDVKKGSRAMTPVVAVTPEGKAYAFVFHDHAKDVDVEDVLQVVALDPNGDGDFGDARVVKTLAVGKSAVEGHFGHHAMAFDAERRFAFFTNPGDGTISALSLKSLEVVATFKVGGTPTAIVARGGRDVDD